MGNLARMLAFLPKNMTVPAVVLALGWYGGAKYGAPDYVMDSIDGMFAEGTEMVRGVLENGDAHSE